MSNNLNVLIVEDEPIIATLLQKILTQLGCTEIWTCSNALCAFETVKKEKIDLIFMDLNIEGKIDGIQCAKKIALSHNVLIAFATSYSDPDTLEEAIDVNTLNYLVKPYGKKDIEITLNLAKASRKKSQKSSNTIEDKLTYMNNNYCIDTEMRQVSKEGKIIKLSKKEFDLLVMLVKYSPSMVHTDKIIQYIWSNRTIASSTLRETLTRIRKKLPGIDIKAVHGMGYQII
ncbi:MAG: hypothetical protein DRG09_02345 [Epsilonproteobacteria bacterium]|nr:MAG: hypothetical protein DRG09_02345 [Campylobacterota bacterium]